MYVITVGLILSSYPCVPLDGAAGVTRLLRKHSSDE
jgi:hypothetical protein